MPVSIGDLRPLINTLHVLWSVLPLNDFNWLDDLQRLPDDCMMDDRRVAYLMSIKRKFYKLQPYHPEWDVLAAKEPTNEPTVTPAA